MSIFNHKFIFLFFFDRFISLRILLVLRIRNFYREIKEICRPQYSVITPDYVISNNIFIQYLPDQEIRYVIEIVKYKKTPFYNIPYGLKKRCDIVM